MPGGRFVFSHIALPVTDLDQSLAFYEQYVSLKVVDKINLAGNKAARLSDEGGNMSLVLLERPMASEHALSGAGHIGVLCESREEVNEVARKAETKGMAAEGPSEAEVPGYHVFLNDPDGHRVKLYFGGTGG